MCRYLWRSHAVKFWPLLERTEALITVAPAAVSVMVSEYWLMAQGRGWCRHVDRLRRVPGGVSDGEVVVPMLVVVDADRQLVTRFRLGWFRDVNDPDAVLV